MEYNQLAAFVGVQLDSSRDGMSEQSSQISSAAISARNRINLEIKKRAKEDWVKSNEEAARISQQKEQAAKEAEELKRSIEITKAKLQGMPTVVEARSSYETSVAGNSGRFSSNPQVLRESRENPLAEVEDIPNLEVARNLAQAPANQVEEEEDEYTYESYDEEEEEMEGELL